ncbi:MAG: hypothetical protein JWO98_4898 [Frankiales bacterium]|nr:hypothetical protein [Frankiales bacterium]
MSARQAVLLESTTVDAWRPRLVIAGNGARRRLPSLADRFWKQVSDGPNDCWLWTGEQTDDGYGRFSVHPVHIGAHRWAYSLLRAEIPEGLDLDHLCRVTRCVNPWHLEPVTRAENIRRAFVREVCGKGHGLSDAIERTRDGRVARECRQCARDRKRAYARRVRQVVQ